MIRFTSKGADIIADYIETLYALRLVKAGHIRIPLKTEFIDNDAHLEVGIG